MSAEDIRVDSGYSYVRSSDHTKQSLSDANKKALSLGLGNCGEIEVPSEPLSETKTFAKDVNRVGFDLKCKDSSKTITGSDYKPKATGAESIGSNVEPTDSWGQAVKWMQDQIITAQRSHRKAHKIKYSADQVRQSYLHAKVAASAVLAASFASQGFNAVASPMRYMQGHAFAAVASEVFCLTGGDALQQQFYESNGVAITDPKAKTSATKSYQFTFDPETGDLMTASVEIESAGAVEFTCERGCGSSFSERVNFKESQHLVIDLQGLKNDKKAKYHVSEMSLSVEGESPLWDCVHEVAREFQDGKPGGVEKYIKDNPERLLKVTGNNQPVVNYFLSAKQYRKEIVKMAPQGESLVTPGALAEFGGRMLSGCKGYLREVSKEENKEEGKVFSDSCKMAARLISYAQDASPEQQKVASQAIAKLFEHDPGEDLSDSKLQDNQTACMEHLNNSNNQKILKKPHIKPAVMAGLVLLTIFTAGLGAIGFAVVAAQEKKKAAQLAGDMGSLKSQVKLPRSAGKRGLRTGSSSSGPGWVASGTTKARVETGQGVTPTKSTPKTRGPVPPPPSTDSDGAKPVDDDNGLGIS